MAKKKSFKDDIVDGVGFKDGDVGWVKDVEDDRGRRDAKWRGDDPNAGLGLFRYFDMDDGTNQEISLWAEWLTESHQAYGGDVLYYRLSHIDTNMDQLYGEAQLERYGKPRRCRVLFENIEEPNRFWSAFGMMADEEFNMTLTKDEYATKIDSTGTPRVGDVVRTTWNNVNYEVTYVHDHPVMAYVSSLWTFTLKRFEFSYQEDVTPDHPHADPNLRLFTDSTQSEFDGADNEFIEEESNEIVDYDVEEDLDDDLFGSY